MSGFINAFFEYKLKFVDLLFIVIRDDMPLHFVWLLILLRMFSSLMMIGDF